MSNNLGKDSDQNSVIAVTLQYLIGTTAVRRVNMTAVGTVVSSKSKLRSKQVNFERLATEWGGRKFMSGTSLSRVTTTLRLTADSSDASFQIVFDPVALSHEFLTLVLLVYIISTASLGVQSCFLFHH